MAGDLPKVRISYQHASESRVVPVSGAWGGLTPQGDVFLCLYQELPMPPVETVRDQNTGEEKSSTREGMFEIARQIHIQAVLRPDVARAIAGFLERAAEKAEAATAESSKSDK